MEEQTAREAARAAGRTAIMLLPNMRQLEFAFFCLLASLCLELVDRFRPNL
jgi:hypothetical protein